MKTRSQTAATQKAAPPKKPTPAKTKPTAPTPAKAKAAKPTLAEPKLTPAEKKSMPRKETSIPKKNTKSKQPLQFSESEEYKKCLSSILKLAASAKATPTPKILRVPKTPKSTPARKTVAQEERGDADWNPPYTITKENSGYFLWRMKTVGDSIRRIVQSEVSLPLTMRKTYNLAIGEYLVDKFESQFQTELAFACKERIAAHRVEAEKDTAILAKVTKALTYKDQNKFQNSLKRSHDGKNDGRNTRARRSA